MKSNKTTVVPKTFYCPAAGIFEGYFIFIFFHWLGLASIEPREKKPFPAAIRYVVPGFIRVYLWAGNPGITEGCCWVRGQSTILPKIVLPPFSGPDAD